MSWDSHSLDQTFTNKIASSPSSALMLILSPTYLAIYDIQREHTQATVRLRPYVRRTVGSNKLNSTVNIGNFRWSSYICRGYDIGDRQAHPRNESGRYRGGF